MNFIETNKISATHRHFNIWPLKNEIGTLVHFQDQLQFKKLRALIKTCLIPSQYLLSTFIFFFVPLISP